jgi:hypothetical protein
MLPRAFVPGGRHFDRAVALTLQLAGGRAGSAAPRRVLVGPRALSSLCPRAGRPLVGARAAGHNVQRGMICTGTLRLSGRLQGAKALIAGPLVSSYHACPVGSRHLHSLFVLIQRYPIRWFDHAMCWARRSVAFSEHSADESCGNPLTPQPLSQPGRGEMPQYLGGTSLQGIGIGEIIRQPARASARVQCTLGRHGRSEML